MKNRRRLLVLGLFAAVISLAGYVGWRQAFGLPRGVTRDGFDWIAERMTLAKVEAVFGRPADKFYDLSGAHLAYLSQGIWYADDDKAAVLVVFDWNENVAGKELIFATSF